MKGVYNFIVILIVISIISLQFINLPISSSSRGVIRSQTENTKIVSVVGGRVITNHLQRNNQQIKQGDTLLVVTSEQLDTQKSLQSNQSSDYFAQLQDLNKLTREHYDRMHQKLTQNANYAKKMVRVRSKTVEPVIGTLVNFTNMKRVNTRGIKNANKHVLMASLTYNLKKYLRFITKKPSILAQVLSLKQGKNFAFVNQSSQASITQF